MNHYSLYLQPPARRPVDPVRAAVWGVALPLLGVLELWGVVHLFVKVLGS